MKKRALALVVTVVLALSVITGCGKSASGEKSKGNGDLFELMEALNYDDTVEEMNTIIGFEGEKTSDEESYQTYVWELTEETSITAQFFTSSGTAKISADYPNKMITKKADFSRFDEIGDALDNGESLSYDQFVEIVGGVQGTMDAKSSSDVTYKWLNDDGGYLLGYFDNETGDCSMATGWF